MAEYSTLKNKIELTATSSLLTGIKMLFYWEEAARNSNNKINNTTNLTWEMWLELTPEELNSSLKSFYPSFEVEINGTVYTVPAMGSRTIKNIEGAVKISDSTKKAIEVAHDAYGNFAGEFNFYTPRSMTYYTYSSPTSKSIPKEEGFAASNIPFTLSSIPQIGYISSLDRSSYRETHDELTMNYVVTAPSGNVEKLEACISVTGLTANIPYREVTASTTTGLGSYTFYLTEEDKQALYPATVNATTGTIRVYLKTTLIDGTVYWDFVDTKYSILTDYLPSLDPSVKDINTTTVALTGDENVIVKHMSNAYYDTGAMVRKGAQFKELKIDNETQVVSDTTTTTGVIEEAESGEFTFTLVDTRGDKVTETVSKTMIPYFKPICNQKENIIFEGASSAKAIVSISGSFFNQSFGAASNSLKVFIQHTLNDGSMSDWIDVNSILAEVNIEGNNYQVNFEISGLEYDRLYTFQCKAVDKLAEGVSARYSTRATPIFDWSENDFNFNVPVTAKSGLDVTGDLVNNGVKVRGIYILSDTNTAGSITLNDSIANYEFIEILYTDNNGKTFGSTKIPAGTTNTLTVTLSLIEPRYYANGDPEDQTYNQTMIRATTYLIKEKAVTVSAANQGILYLDDEFNHHVADNNYIKIVKVLGYK